MRPARTYSVLKPEACAGDSYCRQPRDANRCEAQQKRACGHVRHTRVQPPTSGGESDRGRRMKILQMVCDLFLPPTTERAGQAAQMAGYLWAHAGTRSTFPVSTGEEARGAWRAGPILRTEHREDMSIREDAKGRGVHAARLQQRCPRARFPLICATHLPVRYDVSSRQTRR